MTSTLYTHLEENFLREPSKVDDVIKFLDDIAHASKMENTTEKAEPVDISAGLTDTNFMVTKRMSWNPYRKKPSSRKISLVANLNEMSFMRQIEVSDEDRLTAHEDRIRVANNFRKLGNAEFRKPNYDKAIDMYTQGLQYVTDTPVLYLNRALCFSKKNEFKRALIDLEYVLLNLDGRNMRAWLYKAGVLNRLRDEAGSKECIAKARRYNREHIKYVDYFATKMMTDF